MTVTTQVTQNEYTGGGGQTVFAFTFVVLSPDQVRAWVNGISEPHTVSVNANQSTSPGGTVTFDVAPPNFSEVLLFRLVAPTQLTDYPIYTRFPAQEHEQALDKLTLLVQDLRRQDGLLAFDIAINAANIADNTADIAQNASDITDLENAVNTLEANQIISSDTQTLTITNPTLADNVTLNPITNVANGLVKLDGTGTIPVSLIPPTGGNEFPGNNPSNPVGGDPSAALIIGTVNPDIEPSMGIGPSIIQTRADQNTIANMQINPYGGDVTIGNESTMGITVYDLGPTLVYQEGNLVVSFATNFTTIYNDLSLIGNHMVRVGQGSYGPGGTDLSISFNGDPDTGFCSPGPNILQMVSNADNFSLASNVSLYSDFAIFGSGASQIFAYNSVHGGFPNTITIGTSGTTRAIFDDTNGCLFLDNGNNLVARTIPPAAGGLEVNNLLTGAGFERVLTTADVGVGSGDFLANGSVPMTGTMHWSLDALITTDNVNDDLWLRTSNLSGNNYLKLNAIGVLSFEVEDEPAFYVNELEVTKRQSIAGQDGFFRIEDPSYNLLVQFGYDGATNHAYIECDPEGVDLRFTIDPPGAGGQVEVLRLNATSGYVEAINQAQSGLERVLTESDMSGPTRLVLSANATRTSTNTPTAEADLNNQVAIPANTVARVRMGLIVSQSGAANGGFRVTFGDGNFNYTSNYRYINNSGSLAGAGSSGDSGTATHTVIGGALATFRALFEVEATIENPTGAPINFQFLWAQGGSDPDPTTLHAGSWVEITT